MDRSRNESRPLRSQLECRTPAHVAGLEEWWTARRRVRAGFRVLVAGDHPAFANDVRELLVCMGATVLLVPDGAQAVALSRGNNVDLVLMDLHMPVLDGLHATMQIRQHERENLCPRVTVVAHTSSAVDSRLMRHLGIDAVLDKPCTEVALIECVARWSDPWDAAPIGPARLH